MGGAEFPTGGWGSPPPAGAGAGADPPRNGNAVNVSAYILMPAALDLPIVNCLWLFSLPETSLTLTQRDALTLLLLKHSGST